MVFYTNIDKTRQNMAKAGSDVISLLADDV